MKKRMLSMLLAVVMVLSLLPTVALAGTSKLSAPILSVYCRASDGKPVVKWNAVSGAAKYEVYCATKKTGEYKKMMTTTSTKYINTSAKVGHTYFYKVRALSASGKVSSFSAVRHLTCDCARPVVSITCNSANKPKLTWKAIDGAAKYAIYRSADGGKTYKHLSDITKTSFTNTSAKLKTTYRYKVKAISSATKYANSAMSAVKKIKCLPNPVLKSVSNTTNGVLVKWGAVSGAAKYRVYYKIGNISWIKAGDTTNTSLTVKRLTSGKKYSFTVRCLNADGVFISYYDTTGKSITRKDPSIPESMVYDCGYPNHTCVNSIVHKSVMNATCDYCGQSGSDPNCTCPAVLGIGECPKYDVKKDATVYCQTCGKKGDPMYGAGTKGTCASNWVDWHCSYCGKNVPAWECHSCR